VKRLTLVQGYAVRSAVFVGVMAAVLALVLSYAIREVSLQASTRTAVIAADQVFLPHIDDADFSAARFPASTTAELQGLADTELSGTDIVAVKIWSPSGRLMFSSDRSDTLGVSFPEHEALAKALGGELTREISTEADEENENQFAREGSVMEIYSPIKGPSADAPLGVFEIYQSYAPVTASIWRTIALIVLVILAGAIPFYLLQLRFVQKAASQLDSAQSDLQEVNTRLESSLDDMAMHSLGTLQALVAAVDAKDSYTARHSIAVTDYAVAIGRRMGLSDTQLTALERAGLLHDVGKIGTPETVLLKPSALTDDEFDIIKEHSEMSGHIVETIPFVADLMPAVRSHHERWDGTGYPDGLKEESIPLLARILTVADAFDAMTSDRPYRKGMPIAEAAAEIVLFKGSQFDPAIVDILLAALAAQEISVVIHDIPMRPRRRERAAS